MKKIMIRVINIIINCNNKTNGKKKKNNHNDDRNDDDIITIRILITGIK